MNMKEMEESSFAAAQPVLASDTFGWDKLQVSQWYSPQQAFTPSSESKYLIGIHCTAYYENYYTIHITPVMRVFFALGAEPRSIF